MNFDEEDEEAKEIDQLNKIIENNLKLEMAINEKLEETEESLKKYDWKVLGDFTHHFRQNIERIWDIIKSLDYVFLLNNSQNYPIIFKKGSNLYNQGNIFEGKLFNEYEFKAKVIKEKIFSDIINIEWIFYLGNGEGFRLKMTLYKVTEDNSTVIYMKTKYIPSPGESFILKIKEKFNEKDFVKTIEKLLKKEKVFFYQYESGLILGDLKEIWDILIDPTKLALIAPNNNCFVPININNVKVGDISKIGMSIKSIDGFLEIKLDLKEQKEEWNKWVFGYSILGGGPFKVIRQAVMVQLTRINKYETQLSVFTKILESINMKMLKQLSEKKKYVIASLKDYFENFSTPQNDVDNELHGDI